MPKIDLDARRAARAEQRAKDGVEPNVMVLDGSEFALAPELPVTFIEALQRTDFRACLEAIVVKSEPKKGQKADSLPDPVAQVYEMGLSIDDLAEIVKDVYGDQLGNLLS